MSIIAKASEKEFDHIPLPEAISHPTFRQLWKILLPIS